MEAVTAPDVLFLELVCGVVLLTEGKGGQKHPFGNGRTVYATARRYVNFRVKYYGMFGQMIYASGKEMDESESKGQVSFFFFFSFSYSCVQYVHRSVLRIVSYRSRKQWGWGQVPWCRLSS